MEKMIISVGIVFVLGLTACSGNDDVDFTNPWLEEYELPQGKSDADDRIVWYHEKFGTYILYEYTNEDFNYELGGMTIDYELPTPVYVGDMLDLLEDIWFDFYPAEFHKKFMPLKIMLADHITTIDQFTGMHYPTFMLTGSACVGFGFCSDTLQKITSATKLELKNIIHQSLWGIWVERIEIPEDFFAVSDYSHEAVADPSLDDYTRNRGFIAYNGYDWSLNGDWQTGILDEQTDLTSFLVGMILKTSADWEEDLKWPLVKQKYDILRNWIQETYGFDLQKVGDATYD